jgi:serine/threonine-protein phosphatase 5
MIVLLAYKITSPKCIYLNRGNHEARELNAMYGFEGEVISKYCSDTFLLFLSLFKCLPIAHVINKEIFVVHGGLAQN